MDHKIFRYGVAQFLFVGLCFYYFGFCYGFFAMYILSGVIKKVLENYGIFVMTGGDRSQTIESETSQNNVTGHLVFKGLTFDDFKEKVHQRLILNIRKFRQTRLDAFGLAFWKDIDVEVALDQVREVKEDFKSNEEFEAYVSKKLLTDFEHGKPSWVMYFKENFDEETSVLYMIFHHSFSDGVGFAKVLACLADNKDLSMVYKNVPEKGLFARILHRIKTPKFLGDMGKLTADMDTDRGGKAIRDTKNNNSEQEYYSTKDFDFKGKLRQAYKKYEGRTFNDFILGVISTALHKWYVDHGVKDAHWITTLIAVCLKNCPHDLTQLALENDVIGTKVRIAIEKDIEDAMRKNDKDWKQQLDYELLTGIDNSVCASKYYPKQVVSAILHDVFKNIDFSISNLSMPSQVIYVNGCELTSVKIGVTTPMALGISIIFTTYAGKMNYTVIGKSKLKMGTKKFTEFLEEATEDQIKDL